jgi:hypothetical protein
MYIRLPFTFPVQMLTELIGRLHKAWTELQRHGPRTRLRPGSVYVTTWGRFLVGDGTRRL